jgi:hypothetical protein
MKRLAKYSGIALLGFLVLIAGFDIWGYATQGSLTPDPNAYRDPEANKVVMVLGATGSAGDGLLKAAVEDPAVERVIVLTRRSSARIDAGVASGRIEMILHQDFTDYSELTDVLAQVNTVLWGLGTSSLQVDDATYTLIHVDFTLAFAKAWLAARPEGPMSLHYITGGGTDPEGDYHWAREKGRMEREMTALGEVSPMRFYSYHSAYIRPASENATVFNYLGELLLRPGKLVITSNALGDSMLEISARTTELPNGTQIDNADSIAYAQVHNQPD